MRIINKKYLLIILLIGIILTSVIVAKPKQEVKLDNVILKQEINNKTFAMYKETDNGYEEYNGNTFPKGYKLNVDKSKCVDTDGVEIENALYTKDNKVGVRSNKSFYCYLYFDEKENLNDICNGSTMEECMSNPDKLNKIKTIDNLSDETKGDMYRYQGQAVDVDNNYICFGTSDKADCVKDTDHYMYRIIGIEESGRTKVIKKEALNETYQWYTDYDTDIDFPNSKLYEAISGEDFLKNNNYIPAGWEEKMTKNTWIYGDMLNNGITGAGQTGERLYLIESGQEKTIWNTKANMEDNGAQTYIVQDEQSQYFGETIYYIEHNNEKWSKTFEGKVSLMYISDYLYSIGNEINCDFYYATETEYKKCQQGWIHLSQNDTSAPDIDELTMTRYGWYTWYGFFRNYYVDSTGAIDSMALKSNRSIRPVFYIDASQKIIDGLGAIDNPYIIN